MPINEITPSNLKWKNINIGVANLASAQELPDTFDVFNGAGNFICQGTRQMEGKRLYIPDLFEDPPPANLHGAPVPVALGDNVTWSVRDHRLVITDVHHQVYLHGVVPVEAVPPLPINDLPALAAPLSPPIDPTVSSDALRRIGFRDVASWRLDAHGNLMFSDLQPGFDGWRGWNPSLYAHCDGQTVCYLGKSKRLLSKRMDDYRLGLGKDTNYRIHQGIRATLGTGRAVHILGFCPVQYLEWGGFKINLAAGLEDILIDHFQPVWNA
jgi:hypothetical protein